MHARASTRDGHIQSALPAALIQRPEVLPDLPVFIRAEGCGEIDDAAFISLYIFQVFHKDGVFVILGKIGLQLGVLPAGFFQHVFDENLLLRVEGDNADGGVLVILESRRLEYCQHMRHQSRRFLLIRVIRGAVNALDGVVDQGRISRHGSGEGGELAVVIVLVGEGNEGF